MDGHEAAQERAANPALNWLRQVCLAAEAEARLDELLTASDIAEICVAYSLEIPGVASDALDSKVLLRIGQIMGKAFKNSQIVDCDGFEIVKKRGQPIQRGAPPRRNTQKVCYSAFCASLRLVRPITHYPLKNVNIF